VVDERLATLLGRLGDVHPDACCAGAAGAEAPDARDRLQDFLARRFPTSRTCVVHDSHLVLAAAGRDAGIALIAGTGTVAYARAPDGRESRRGGWGWLVGDEGGGVWITREAARLVMTRAERGAGIGIGALGEALLAACGASVPEQMLASLHDRHEPMQWAALAATVFDTADQDAGARDIIHRAAAELVRLVLPLRDVCPDGPVVLAGGLLLNQSRLESEVRALIPVECIRLVEPPVEGALRLAEGLLR
jgi:N-acetylglucosamine kinase-like BadF-type ATPase